ncbi:sensor domain-containing diguanylate cyclase [Zoogloea dura]|uniref:diguanylate cyclase n=1 Tax=Zoogloea dura TaxID=2728840 RepID=A0A848GBB2_9RHOO|nr:diguanylate cyclase [Zoogloea dura]NML26811.1 diguanylate cyclase [Zoogloea dura]
MFSRSRPITLQRLLVLALLLVVVPMVAVQAWFYYLTAQRSAVQFQEQLASEVSARVYDKVLQFFDVPQRVVRFNAEQFRAGVLNPADSEGMQRNFLLQLRQQPLLTFLSVGTAEGEYFSASRPVQGEDRALRLLQATQVDGRQMGLYRVSADDRRGEFIAWGNPHFDARTRPWFKAAMGRDSLRWYPAYRYAINDPKGAYDAMGIGMASPLHDAAGRFIGVVTADVALTQLSELLAGITRDLGGTAFLMDEAGDLLAASTLEPLYELQADQTRRIRATESPNPLISAASRVVKEADQLKGRAFRDVAGQTYLLDWWAYPLPDGPTLTIGVVLPQSRVDAPSRSLLFNTALFSAAILVLSVAVALVVSRRVARPLEALGAWAARLGHGEWREVAPGASAIAEVEALSRALHLMADGVRYHTANLEHEVAARTAELEEANLELARRSDTDGLTGLANRRCFDEALQGELSRACRARRPLALIMIDVDHFKQYNDYYGHLAGDDCLRRVAAVLEAGVHRPGDLCARYGGEEFAVIAASSDAAGMAVLAERLRAGVEQLEIPHAGSPCGVVTASFGVAVLVPDSNKVAERLIRLADEALYEAKEQGRNRVVMAPQ